MKEFNKNCSDTIYRTYNICRINATTSAINAKCSGAIYRT